MEQDHQKEKKHPEKVAKLIEAGKSTRFPNNDPTKGGRNPSVRKQIRQLLNANGHFVIPRDLVVNEAPDELTIELPTELAIAQRLLDLAARGGAKTALDAIKVILDQIDGKPTQEIQGNMNFNGFKLSQLIEFVDNDD